MRTYALTGGMGMGKSTAAAWLKSRGVAVLDTDDLAREVTRPGEEALARLSEHFGKKILREDGSLNRPLLAEIVFRDERERRFLEATLHPLIRQRWRAWCRELRENEPPPFCVVVIPLLFETGAQGEFDEVVCVACLPEIQKERLLKRGLSEEEIAGRLAAQWPIEEKIRLSHHVVHNNGTPEELYAELSRVFFP